MKNDFVKINDDEKSSKKEEEILSFERSKKVVFDKLKLIGGLVVFIVIVWGVVRIDASRIVVLGLNGGEQTITENLQLVFLAISAYSFFRVGFLKVEIKRAAVLIGAFYCVCFIRELDYLFDMIYHGAWVIPALIVTFAALFYAFRDWKKGFKELGEVLDIKAMNLVIIGTILLLVYSRLIGMGSTWEIIMGDNYVYRVKTLIEEGTELLCYSLIAFGAMRTKKELLQDDAN